MLTSAGKEWLKWIALVAMTCDHANKVLQLDMPALSAFGRLAWPLFAVVLVDNVRSHPDRGAGQRAVWRLLLAGALVQPLYAYTFGAWLPLNVLLAFALGLYLLSEQRWPLALLVWAIGGLLVEMAWFGPLLFFCAAFWMARPNSLSSWAVLVIGIAGLCVINCNGWALLAVPMIWLAQYVPGRVPRWRWLFLGYYFAHLLVLAGIKWHLLPSVV